VVVFAVKTQEPTAAPLPPLERLAPGCCRYRVPPARNPEVIDLGVPVEEVLREARDSPAWRRLWDKLEGSPLVGRQPLMPLRKGHLALLVAGSLEVQHWQTNGENRERLVLKGEEVALIARLQRDEDTPNS